MAVLQKIRNKSGLLVGVIAVGLLAFVLPWGEITSLIRTQKDKAFVVDGDIVSTGAYHERITNFETFQKMISGQTSLDENTSSQIREFVYEQMVKEMMLDKEAEKIGLSVTDEELTDMISGANPSPMLRQIPLFVDPQTGQFSVQALNQFLSLVNTDIKSVPLEQQAQLEGLKSVWETIRGMIKYQRLEEKYNSLIANAVITNDIEAKANSEATKATSDIAYVINRYSSVPDSTVSVTDKEIEKLYNERKNNFKTQDELRKISYFTKQIVPSDADYAAIEKEANTAREKLASSENPALVVADYSEVPYQDIYFSEKNLSQEEAQFAKTASNGDIYGPIRDNDAYRIYKLIDRTAAPDSVKMRMIIVPEGADKLAAAAKADSIINVIKQGKDFATVANEIFPQSNGGEVGWVTEPQLASAGKEFVDAAFKTPTGEITKLNLQGQIQIIKIEEKTQPITKYKLALIQIPVTVSDQTLAGLDNEMNEFVAQNGNASNFVKAAQDKGYNVVPNTVISGAYPNIAQINGSRQVISWAFHEKVGSIKKFDLSDYKIVAVINSKIDAGYLPVSEVKDVLKSELVRDKKAEKMITDLKAKNLTTLGDYAQSLGSKVDTVKFVTFNTPNIMGIGRESALNVYAEVGQVNKMEGPVKGDNGVLVLTVLNKTDQSKDFNIESFKQTANSQNMYRVMSQAMQVLKEKMAVKDNRIEFF
ncbi:peptidylprolyl isomerase [Dysgonomonas macrotermitis]|uniref:Periplasmic chaperone PpiD n=1 Tax=Dysgonomonas macrotermitis TaxID=1346286 RepID=A0A1M5BDJ7_9BACT|nr:peptidylprolyl isomerase [Dysgonomonas macrotermitis]SHF40460.1 peptidyl-prolyl cis-trans isomerase D [Dysgonomonas macrotermitis]